MIIAFFTLFLISHSAYSTHIVGGSITYRCLGNDQYEISLTVRRDCINGDPGAQFDDPAALGIYDGSGILRSELAANGVLRMNLRPDDTLNEVVNSRCGIIGGDICVHTTTYREIVSLPYRADGYILAYQRCCRNFTISNIVNPLTVGSTFTARIYESALRECNSSPDFNAWPPIYVCGNSALNFNLKATDEEGDSLVYELCNPLTGASQAIPRPATPSAPPYQPVVFKAPYSLSNVIGGIPALTMNKSTGRMTGFVEPTITQYLIAYCIKEYRKGVLLSELQREFQINVRTCVSNAIASFEYDVNRCGDSVRIQFNNKSSTPNSGLKNSYWFFVHNGIQTNSKQFNPIISLGDSGQLEVTLVAESNEGCTDTFRRKIPYQSVKPNFTQEEIKICKGDSIQLLKNFVQGPVYTWSPSIGLSCTQCPNPVAKPITDTWYVLLTEDFNCVRKDSILVKVDPCIVDSCAIFLKQKCLPGGSVELTIEDAFGQLVNPKLREFELFWNIKASPKQSSFSIRDKNPIVLPSGTEFSITSKIYRYPKGAPKSIEYAQICQRRIEEKAIPDCPGPCNNIEFILSSCEDTYDMDNNLDFPPALCKSLCKNECLFIVALFEKNGKLINPSDYQIKWSTGGSGAFVEVMMPYYNTLTVEVRKGDCVWYGRYIRSCRNSTTADPNSQNEINTSNHSYSLNMNTNKKSAEVSANSDHLDDNVSFSLIPNPVVHQTILKYQGQESITEVHYEILELSGNCVLSGITQNHGFNEFYLNDLNALSAGTYFIIIQFKEKEFCQLRFFKL